MGSPPPLYGILRFMSLVCHCAQLSPFSNPLLTSSESISLTSSPLSSATQNQVSSTQWSSPPSFALRLFVKMSEILVSFDLFTNVPVKLQLRVQDADYRPVTTSLPAHLLPALRVLSHSYVLYKQVFGTAMGSPVSVAVAKLVMEDVEDRTLETFDIQLPFWK